MNPNTDYRFVNNYNIINTSYTYCFFFFFSNNDVPLLLAVNNTLSAKTAPGVRRSGNGNDVVALFALAQRVVVHLCAHRVFVLQLARVVLEALFAQSWNQTSGNGSVFVRFWKLAIILGLCCFTLRPHFPVRPFSKHYIQISRHCNPTRLRRILCALIGLDKTRFRFGIKR